MTAPAPLAPVPYTTAAAAPYPYEPPPAPEDDNPVLAALVVALAAFLASSAALAAVVLPAGLVAAMVAAGIAPKAAKAAGRIALSVKMTGRTRWGAPGRRAGDTARRRAAAEEPTMRARYIVNAARRLTDGLVEGTFLDDLAAERRHLVAHVEAGRNRSRAARSLDQAAAEQGPWLVWVTHPEKGDVTPDCAARAGEICSADDLFWPPPGGMHPKCKCTSRGATGADLANGSISRNGGLAA